MTAATADLRFIDARCVFTVSAAIFLVLSHHAFAGSVPARFSILKVVHYLAPLLKTSVRAVARIVCTLPNNRALIRTRRHA